MFDFVLTLSMIGLMTLFLRVPFVANALQPLWARLLDHPPNIRLEELGTLLPEGEEVAVSTNRPRRIPGADMSVQLSCGNISVIYSRIDLGGIDVETIDISTPPKAGINLLVKDGIVVVLENVGGMTIRNPHITDDGSRAIRQFLNKVRHLAATV